MLSRAIEESLALVSNHEDVFEELPLEKQVRKGGRCAIPSKWRNYMSSFDNCLDRWLSVRLHRV